MLTLKVDPINYKAGGIFSQDFIPGKLTADVMLDGILTEAEVSRRSTVAYSTHYQIMINSVSVATANLNLIQRALDLTILMPSVGEKQPDQVTLILHDGNFDVNP